MAQGYQLVVVNGTLGQDPEVRYSGSGTAVANFSVAVKEKYKGEEKTEWVRLVAFGAVAENIGKFMHKGQNHTFVGKLQTRKWEKDGVDRYTTEVVVREFHFGNNPRRDEQPKDYHQGTPDKEQGGMDFDDIPFAKVDWRLA